MFVVSTSYLLNTTTLTSNQLSPFVFYRQVGRTLLLETKRVFRENEGHVSDILTHRETGPTYFILGNETSFS